MKKSTKIFLLIFAVFTLAVTVTSLIMLNAVSGYKLLYMNSQKGEFYVSAYKWVGLAAIAMLTAWVVILLANIKKIKGFFTGLKSKMESAAAMRAQNGAMAAARYEAQQAYQQVSASEQAQQTFQQPPAPEQAQQTFQQPPAPEQAQQIFSQQPSAPVIGGYCTACGSAYDEGASFCQKCGKPVGR